MCVLSRFCYTNIVRNFSFILLYALLSCDGGVTNPADGPASDTETCYTHDPATLDNDILVTDLQFSGSHNSYHQEPAMPLHPAHEYSHKTLTEQLTAGIRVFELDTNLSGGDGNVTADDVEVFHIAVIDKETSCLKLVDCLSEIAEFSRENRSHTPIFLWLEVKDFIQKDHKTSFDFLDAMLIDSFGRDGLYSPDQFLGSCSSLKKKREIAGWPSVDSLRGKVVPILLNRDSFSETYTHGFQHLRGRVMFANVSDSMLDAPFVTIWKYEVDAPSDLQAALGKNMLTAANVCLADTPIDTCAARSEMLLDAGIHMLKDDFPFGDARHSYALDLPGLSPRCNRRSTCLPSTIEP